MDNSVVIRHYIDCYVYGAEFEDNCIDPLITAFETLYIPTDYQVYIKGMVRTYTENFIDDVLGSVIETDMSYTIEWLAPTTGVIEKFHGYHFDKHALKRKSMKKLLDVPDYYNSSYYSPYGSTYFDK
jgi:hypothetical protein